MPCKKATGTEAEEQAARPSLPARSLNKKQLLKEILFYGPAGNKARGIRAVRFCT
jgi:hypothetical protein